jgi:CRP-like cAMP-binding protein
MGTSTIKVPTRLGRTVGGDGYAVPDVRVTERLSPEVLAAWQSSAFAQIPAAAANRLLASGAELRVASGEHMQGTWRSHGEEVSGDYCALVATGLMRVYAHHLRRQVTLRYVSPGFTLGIASAFVGTDRYGVQAVADSRLLRIRSAVLRTLARGDPRVASVLCQLMATSLYETSDVVSSNVFNPLRQRVARHLLELADRDEHGRFTVRANPQDIADACGTVREVVTRVIKRMREEGLVFREARLYVLPDPGALHVIASGDEPREAPPADSA